jgi:Protein of unknown function (DUF4232)
MTPRATRPVLAALALAATAALATACGSSAPPAAAPAVTVTTTAPASAPTSPAAGGASTAPAAATSSAGTPAGCSTRYLHGAIEDSNGGAGSIYSEIVFKNLNNVSCTMYGYPGVATSEGLPIKLVGATAAEDSAIPRQLVTLPPHGYAHAQFRVTEAANYPAGKCHEVTVHWLQVIPPNQVAGLYVPYKTQTCLDTSTRTMSVGAVRPGRGSASG